MNEDNLTRAEAQERASMLSELSYDVDVDLTGEGDTYASTTVIRFSAQAGAATFVDLDATAVRELTLNGEAVPLDAFDADRSRITLPAVAARNELRVVADCAYQHTGVGLHRFDDPTDGNRYLHTQFEPYDAHRVFACFDQPDLKGTFDLAVTAPEGWTVVSNNPVAKREGAEQNAVRWRYETTPVISTYLVAIVAGAYHVVEERHGGVGMALYCRESLAQYLDADEIFTVTRQGLDFFEAEFGYPYPFEKYDQLFVPEFNFGAMENPGCITFNEGYIFRSRVTDASFENRAGTILHEMAHMWFGDLVTMYWWDDLWLNESFATYMGNDAVARATRFSDAWARFAAGTKGWALVQDQLPTTHPISADIVDTDAVRLHFDGITYAKGASVLKQLVAWVGRDAFAEGVRRYFRRHEWANAGLADFLGALEETSGRDLSAWAEEWLQTAGVNTIRASFTTASDSIGDGVYTSFSLEQAGEPLRSHRLAVGLYDLGDEGLTRRRRVELDVVGTSTDVVDLVGERAADLVLVNDDDLAYTKIRLDERSLDTLEAHLSDIVDPLARNLCWSATWDMVRDAELATRRFVALVRRPGRGRRQHARPTAGPGLDRRRRLRRPCQPHPHPRRAGGRRPHRADRRRPGLRPATDLGPPAAVDGRQPGGPGLRPRPARRLAGGPGPEGRHRPALADRGHAGRQRRPRRAGAHRRRAGTRPHRHRRATGGVGAGVAAPPRGQGRRVGPGDVARRAPRHRPLHRRWVLAVRPGQPAGALRRHLLRFRPRLVGPAGPGGGHRPGQRPLPPHAGGAPRDRGHRPRAGRRGPARPDPAHPPGGQGLDGAGGAGAGGRRGPRRSRGGRVAAPPALPNPIGGLQCAVAPAPPAPLIADAVVAGGGSLADPSEAEVLVWTDPTDASALADLLAGAPQIEWVQLPFAGVDTFLELIDDGRTWTSTKGAYSEPVAEHAMALGLAGLRQLKVRARADRWGEQAGRRLMGGRVTLVGGGGIAQALLRLLGPFHVDATVVRRHIAPVEGAARVVGPDGLHDALPGADLVVLALPLTPDTAGIIAAEELGLMAGHAWLVNVARGKHVVTDDLVAALEAGAIGGAALDVTDPEPLPAGHRLWSLDNCLITPHTSNTWVMAEPLFAQRVVENLGRYQRGEPLLGVVDPALGY